jgi:hypothetical protein
MGDWERRHVVERAPHVPARDHVDVAYLSKFADHFVLN